MTDAMAWLFLTMVPGLMTSLNFRFRFWGVVCFVSSAMAMEAAAALGLALTLATLAADRVQLQRKRVKRRKKVWMREWIRRRYNDEHNTMYKLQLELIELDDTAEFRSMLRMDLPTYQYILETIRDAITRQDTQFRKSVPPEQRLSLTLSYLATGSTNVMLSHHYRVGRSTCGMIIRDTCRAIYNGLKDRYLNTPTDKESWVRNAKLFDLRWNFPHCLGAMDGKHIRIQQPSHSGSKFYNYKLHFSIVLFAIVNGNYEFVYLDVGSEGRQADGGIWKNSTMKAALDEGTISLPATAPLLPNSDENIPFYFIGDDAFPLTPHLLKPFSRRDMSIRERVFNYRLSRARRISENAFGILATRFRVFLAAINRAPDTVVDMCLAAAALHNLLRERCGANYMPPTSIDHEGPNYELIEGDWRKDGQLKKIGKTTHRNPTQYAKAVRECVADYCMSEEGSVPWQLNQI